MNDRRIAGSLLGVIAFLIVFGSLYPFRFSASPDGPIELARHLTFAGTTRSDVAANVLLYLPLGACLAWLAAPRFGAIAAVALATAGGALLSFAIEFTQLFESRRVTSLADLASNSVGAFVGAWIALAIAQARRNPRASSFADLLDHPIAAALLLSWIGYRLAPFAPVLDAAKWTGALEPLSRGGWLAPGEFLPQLLAWLVLIFIAGRLAPRRPLAVACGAMAVVLSGRVLFAGHALEASEVAGMAVALVLSWPLARLPAPRVAMALAIALCAYVAVDGLMPFDFRIAQHPFALLPFGESLTQYRATNLSDMFLRCFLNGALVWLLVRSGLSVLAATAAGAGAVFSVELLQTWLPGQTAEITDPLLAVVAGGLIAVFEPGPGGERAGAGNRGTGSLADGLS